MVYNVKKEAVAYMDKTLYYGGDIITLEENLYAEAILTENGIIKKVGKLEELTPLICENTQKFNLNGNTLLPAFLDAHSHLSAVALSYGMSSLNGAENFAEIKKRLKNFAENNTLKDNDWIIGFGYDNNELAERCHPDKLVLDSLGLKNPILISHASGHMGVVNQKALDIMGITKDSKDTEDGKIGRIENSEEPNGFLEENAFISNTGKIPSPNVANLCEFIEKAQNLYASYGITTAQDGLVNLKELEILKLGNLYLDVIGFVNIKKCPNLLPESKYFKKYDKNLKLGGYKAFLDGSPQGKTAWLTKPYEGEKEYKGYPIYKDEEVIDFFKKALTENTQVLMHCNGDAAVEQFINCYEQAKSKLNSKNNIRPVMIHAQMLRKDLLPKIKELGIIPSYFVSHTYYWGDIHLKNLGERAKEISPLKSSENLNILYTIHQDSPVLPPNMIDLIWCATNRMTKSGKEIGLDERVSTLDAIKAITINTAYQYFEENEKGSIKEKKQADFVILSQNPLKMKIEDIRNIEILETIKKDKSIYKKTI